MGHLSASPIIGEVSSAKRRQGIVGNLSSGSYHQQSLVGEALTTVSRRRSIVGILSSASNSRQSLVGETSSVASPWRDVGILSSGKRRRHSLVGETSLAVSSAERRRQSPIGDPQAPELSRSDSFPRRPLVPQPGRSVNTR
jgi:hypothetical protein